ncbi:heat stress transcription factor A-1-like [Nymphaea colorata]|nr:heat stress transcription factor A-1-like [Nymphaea colorata]
MESGGHAGLGAGAPPPFLSKTYDMVEDPSTDSIVSWSQGNNSFVVWNPPEFARDLLPKYFKHNNFSSFVRQLNTYGFRKVDPDRWEFANEGFIRGQKNLLKTISRRKPIHANAQPQQPQGQSASVGACVEVGKFGLEEEIERLKRDKNVLMQELVRLRQQQQTTDHQLQTLSQRLQGMEQRQQQMMSFLAKAMQSPGFLAQLVQKNDTNRRIAAVNKKRRLPKQEGDSDGDHTPNDGQIIRYQPVNEATKAMLMQILTMGSSPRIEPSSNPPDSFLIDGVPSTSEGFENGTSSQSSGVTLAELKPTSGLEHGPATTGLPEVSSSIVLPEIETSACVSDIVASLSELHDSNVVSGMSESLTPGETMVSVPEFPQVSGLIPAGGAVDIASGTYVAPTTEAGYIDHIPIDGSMPIAADKFSPDVDADILFDGMSMLPDISDFSWDQLLQGSPIPDEIEVDSSTQDAAASTNGPGSIPKENKWDNSNMEQLTQQMELLSSETNG